MRLGSASLLIGLQSGTARSADRPALIRRPDTFLGTHWRLRDRPRPRWPVTHRLWTTLLMPAGSVLVRVVAGEQQDPGHE